jgi:hypothetical protein
VALKPCRECGKEISSEAKQCPNCGAKEPTGRKTSPLALGCLLLIVFAVIGSIVGRGGSSTSQSPTPATPREQALAAVKLNYDWQKGGFGSVMTADFTITNPTAFTVKDIEVTCEHYAASGTKIDSNQRTIYEVVPPKGKKHIRGFSMGFIHSQARSSSCRITDLVVQ